MQYNKKHYPNFSLEDLLLVGDTWSPAIKLYDVTASCGDHEAIFFAWMLQRLYDDHGETSLERA
jgi:hypothetical protein